MSRADVIAVFVCLLFMGAVGLATDNLLEEYERRVACGANLKALATAQVVYANDYDDMYVVQGWGDRRWGRTTPGWYDPAKDWSGEPELTVGASLYLLVRESDVNPESFVCPGSLEEPFDGDNPDGVDILELWDFGSIDYHNTGPKNCVSYSYQQPYSLYPANDRRPWSFAIMSDRSPW